MLQLCSKAMSHGAQRVSLARFVWDISGNCTEPHLTEFQSRPAQSRKVSQGYRRETFAMPFFGETVICEGFAPRPARTESLKHSVLGPKCWGLQLDLSTRCRRCEHCRQHRRVLWQQRATQETRAAPRTWFGTLTVRPEALFLALTKARSRLADQGIDYDGLAIGEQFALLHREISPELTKMLKRLRKQTTAPLRYVIVAEQHKSGAPHYHVLLHEVDIARPVRHAELSAQWRLGFSKWKLVLDSKSAGYVAKYLGKSLAARVRASKHYGDATHYYCIATSESAGCVGPSDPSDGNTRAHRTFRWAHNIDGLTPSRKSRLEPSRTALSDDCEQSSANTGRPGVSEKPQTVGAGGICRSSDRPGANSRDPPGAQGASAHAEVAAASATARPPNHESPVSSGS